VAGYAVLGESRNARNERRICYPRGGRLCSDVARMRAWLSISCSLVFTLLGGAAYADVVPPPPSRCPSGYTPETSHEGPYCRPPLPRCPRGYQPRIWGRTAYCEPPPEHACPPGAQWSSTSEDNTFCVARMACQDGECPGGEACVPTSFCLEPVCFRCAPSRIVGFCERQGDCPENSYCINQRRCDSTVRQGEDPGGSTQYAKPPPGHSDSLELAESDEDRDHQHQELPYPLPRAERAGGCAGCGVAGTEANGTAAVVAIAMGWALRRRRGSSSHTRGGRGAQAHA
jgi:hypothetical protein